MKIPSFYSNYIPGVSGGGGGGGGGGGNTGPSGFFGKVGPFFFPVIKYQTTSPITTMATIIQKRVILQFITKRSFDISNLQFVII